MTDQRDDLRQGALDAFATRLEAHVATLTHDAVLHEGQRRIRRLHFDAGEHLVRVEIEPHGGSGTWTVRLELDPPPITARLCRPDGTVHPPQPTDAMSFADVGPGPLRFVYEASVAQSGSVTNVQTEWFTIP